MVRSFIDCNYYIEKRPFNAASIIAATSGDRSVVDNIFLARGADGPELAPHMIPREID